MFKPITRKDVAKRANVSETIVSYVVNDNRCVSKDKKERVLQAIKELNYKPNSIARALKGKKSNHILFIADDIKSEHFGTLVEKMDAIAYEKSYLISLARYRIDDAFIRSVIGRQVDGIVIGAVTNPSLIVEKFCNANIPVVVLMNQDFTNIDPRAAKIYSGHYSSIKQLVQRFVSNGRKNLVYIDRVNQDYIFSDETDLRLKAFKEEMTTRNMSLKKDTVILGYRDEDELYTGLCERFIKDKSTDGIIARSDRLAYVALKALIACGKKVPSDIAISGFDNSIVSRISSPAVSTVDIDRTRVAQAIVELMEKMIQDNSCSDKVRIFDAIYIQRDSTGF